jgi:urease beta subunit
MAIGAIAIGAVAVGVGARGAVASHATSSLHVRSGQKSDSSVRPNHMAASLSGRPLNFEANLGQAPADVQYLAHGSAYAIELTKQGAALAFGGHGSTAEQVLRLRMQGANQALRPAAEEPLPGRVNYFIGNDPSKWRTNVATYNKVRYAGVYPGIDLVYYGTDGKLEYDFAVAPGFEAKAIELKFEGARRLRVDSHGDLKIQTSNREIAFQRPVAYQSGDAGLRIPVSAQYRLNGTAVRFEVGSYDRSKELIIDPVLSYFSYLGGSGVDYTGITPTTVGQVSGEAAALDSAGELYVTGTTASTNFPVHSAYQSTGPVKTSGQQWAFVSKFAADAKTLIFSTYFGGTNDNDYGYGIAVDANGNAFAVGKAGSSDFPTTSGAYLRVCSPNYTNSPNNPRSGCGNNNGWESFVAKFSPAGALLASTFIGGSHTLSQAIGVSVDASGRPYVAGTTLPGEDIPTGIGGINQAVGFQTTVGAVVRAYPYITNVNVNGALQYDAYVSVFDPTLSNLVYSTLIGDKRPQDGIVQFTSQANTIAGGVTIDAAGNFYLAGYTADAYLPTTTGAYQTASTQCGPYAANGLTYLGGNCGFVAKFSPVGGAQSPTLTYATYLGASYNLLTQTQGGSWVNDITGIVADSLGNAYVVGYTNAAGYLVTTGAYQSTCNGFTGSNFNHGICSAIYISELNGNGTALLASTYFGCVTCSGDPVYTAGAIVRDAAGNIYVGGRGGNSLPVVNGFASTNTTGGQGPFVAEFDSALTTLKFSSFVNVGNAAETGPAGLALDSSGAIYVAGNVNTPATSAATAGAFQMAYGGGSSDGFVAKITVTAATTTTLSIAPTTATTGTSVTFTAMVAESPSTSVPTGTATFKNGSTVLGSVILNSSGIGTLSTSTLAAGSYSVTAAYGGDANNSASTSNAVALTITVPPQPTVSISVAPTSIVQGSSATLTWSSTNATSCTASGAWSGTPATSGTMSVTPNSAGTLSYALACTGAGGTGNGSANLTVTAPPQPTVTISVAPSSITVGANATLTWSSTNATGCTASGGWSGTQTTNGTATVTPSAAGTVTYSLACTGAGGTGNGSASLTVNAQSSGGGGGGAFSLWTLLALLVQALFTLTRCQRGVSDRE